MAVDGSLVFDTQINTSGVSEGISSIEKGFSGIASTAAKTAGAVTTAFTAASTAAVKVGMDFQASTSQVAATMGITSASKEYEMLSAAAKEAGNSTKFTAAEASSALNYLALSGRNAEESIAALPTVLNIAAAGGIELADASDMVTDAMSALGLSTDEMTVFADRLAVTAQKSNTSVAQLGEAILTVGGTAKVLSGGVVEMNTALGILADNGIKSAEGGTALRNVILSLSAPTDKAAAALAELNVTAFDAAGNMRPLQDTFADLNAALSTMSDQEKTAVLNEIFNKVDLKSVNALLGTSAERFEELSGYIADCEGAAADMAKTMNDNLKGDLTILGSALEGAGIAAFEKFEQPLRSAVQGVTESVGDLTASLTDGELSASMDKVATGMSQIAESTLKLVAEDVLPAAINGFAWMADNFDTVVTVAGSAAAGIAAYTVATKGATAATTALSAATSLNPLGLIASTAAIATTAIVTLINRENELIEKSNQLDETTQAIYDQISAYDKLIDTAEENSKEAEKNAAAAKSYWHEVQKLVDEQGNARGSTEELNTAVARLNEVAGTNIEVINGQIQGYKDLSLTMDDYIERVRREAQMSYFKDSYSEALVNIDDTTQQYEETLKRREELYEDYVQKLARLNEYESSGYSDEILHEQLATEVDEAAELFDAAATQVAGLEQQLTSYQSAIDRYEGLAGYDTAATSAGYKSTFQLYAEEQAARIEETGKATAQKLADQQEENLRLLQESWENLEHEYATSSTMTEAELYDKKKALWNEYGDASLKDHWKYIEDISKYDKDYAEEQIKLAQKEADEKKKAAEEATKEEIAARKSEWENIERLNNLGIISDEDAAKTRADFVKNYYGDVDFATGKGVTEENYEYLKKIYDDNADMAKKSLDEQEEIVNDGLSSIVKAYQDAYDQLDKKRESYRQKLMSVGGDLFSVDVTTDKKGKKTTTYTVNNIDEQLRKMREYNTAVKNLMKQGASDELISQLTSMNDEDSMQFAKYLSGMSPAEFAKINELYNEKQKLADELSQDLYKDEAQAISDSYTSALADLATASYEYGAQAAEEFSKGFNASMNKLGAGSLYNQMQASGANQTYQNYWTAKEAEQSIEVVVNQGKTYVVLDGKVLGEANTNYTVEQKRKKGA